MSDNPKTTISTPSHQSASLVSRTTLWDSLDLGAARNIYCNLADLSNEASVEMFFVNRLLMDLGYEDSQIKTKQSVDSIIISKGRKKEMYTPDYVLMVDGLPRCVIDAKGVNEPIDGHRGQCSSYCLGLNQKFPDTNPVRYFVLCNGKTTALYAWDSEQPLLELDFADFTWGNARYDELKKLLGVRSIVAPMLDMNTVRRPDFVFTRPTSEKARQVFAACHRAIWKSEVCSPTAAFMEFVKIMFVKLWCDRNLRDNETIRACLSENASSVKIPHGAVTFSVAWITEREGEKAVNPLDTILFARLRDEIEQNIQLRKKKRLFDQGERIKLRPDTVKDVVARLEHYDMFGIDEDLNGRLFETFLSATMRGRELGQFFTPRSVVKMMTRLADLQATRTHQDRVLDGCCGSGGFLIEALTVMRNQLRSNSSLSAEERKSLIESIGNECFYGVDYGKDPPLARIARINMYLHGDGGSRIYYADGLDKHLDSSHEKDAEIVQNIEELRALIAGTGHFDVVLTNPPFSMTKERRNESERRILEQYDLAKRSTTAISLRPSLRSSIMFLERYYDLLRPGGKLVTIIDDTLLASTMFAYVRDFIRSRFLIRAIISLPGDAFRRQGSRVKTSVLLLEKKRDAGDVQPTCFAYFAETLGLDDLTPRASDTAIQEARNRANVETEDILRGYEGYLAGRQNPFILSPDRLTDRLDLKNCVPQLGRMTATWRACGIDVKRFDQCVTLVDSGFITPSKEPDAEFRLLKVTYDGQCEIESIKLGRAIKAPKMYRVQAGQIIFSAIRATDGAIGIVPEELAGGLVSADSYYVFSGGTPEDTAYLWAVLRSHEIRADMQSLSPGSGRYTTSWPEVGIVELPWLPDAERKRIGGGLLAAWEAERQVTRERAAALAQLDTLGIESEASKKRWRASKAPS
jgi:type I restriction enzyme M protein